MTITGFLRPSPEATARAEASSAAYGITERAPARRLTQLDALEAEAIQIIREISAELERPALLFSGGKDSVVMLHHAAKAFWPSAIPFPVLHVDTGHNFPEVLDYRDETVARLGLRLEVASVQDCINDGRLRERAGGRREGARTSDSSDLTGDGSLRPRAGSSASAWADRSGACAARSTT